MPSQDLGEEHAKTLEQLSTAPWGMLAECGWDIEELADVLSQRFVSRGVRPILWRPLLKYRSRQYKEPAKTYVADTARVGSHIGALDDKQFPDVPIGFERKPSGKCLKSRSALEAHLSREPWWRHRVPSHNQAAVPREWLKCYFQDCGVKVLGETTLKPQEGGSTEPLHLATVRIGRGGTLTVCVELLAALVVVRLYRPVTEGLLASLRGRSRLWAEAAGVSVLDLAHFLPGTLTLALLPGKAEIVSVEAMRGVGYQWSVDVLGSLSRGTLKAPTAPWTRWRDVLRGWAGGGLAGAFERPVQSLVLPA